MKKTAKTTRRGMMAVAAAMAAFTIMAGCAGMSTGGFEVSASLNEKTREVGIADDRAFARCFAVESAVLRCKSSEAEFATAQVRLRNLRKHDIPVQYKFVFFDGDGMELAPESRSWDQKVVHGGEVVSLWATAPMKEAASFTVRVRRAN